MDGTGDAEAGHRNVVRLPREWVGPPEELVPIGPRARDRDRDRETPDPFGDSPATPPAAERAPAPGDFWTAGASAVHHAIQAPDAAQPTAGADRTRTARGPRRGRRRVPAPGRPGRRALSRRAFRVTGAGLVAAAIAAAVIGLTEGPTRRGATGVAGAREAAVQPGPATGSPTADGGPGRTHSRRSATPGSTRSGGDARRATSARRRQLTRGTDRHATRSRQSSRGSHARSRPDGTHVTAVTMTVSTPAPTTSAPSTPAPSPPVATTANAGSGSGATAHRATGSDSQSSGAGPTGTGSAAGCDPKCS